MKSNMLTIMKKEFARFFLDKRMVITTLLLPGLMIYIIYSFMGAGMANKFNTQEDYEAKIYIEHLPESLASAFSQLQAKIQTDEPVEETKKAIKKKEVDVLVQFPENFDTEVVAYDNKAENAKAPNVQIFYNSTAVNSRHAYELVNGVLTEYENYLSNKFDINEGEEGYDLATKEDSTAQVFSNMLPMLMMIFLFSGCMGIVPEAIAGEKERGTIATLLVTPMKRSQLAFGKIISLGTIALLSGISSFAGTMLSLPKLMGGQATNMNASVYKVQDYILLLFVILSTVLVISSAISVISTFAKSVKEANTTVMPLMIVVMLVGVTSMLGDSAVKGAMWYCIPLYNSVQCMTAIFSFDYQLMNIVITLIANLVFSIFMVFVLTKLFNNEKVMFSKS